MSTSNPQVPNTTNAASPSGAARERKQPVRFGDELNRELAGAAAAAARGRSARKGRKGKASKAEEEEDDWEGEDDDDNELGGTGGSPFDHPLLRRAADAAWPEATPTPAGEAFFSVASDGVGWGWTKYQSAESGFYPSLNWRTNRLPPSAVPRNKRHKTDPMEYLGMFLPPGVQDFFFGDHDPRGKPSEAPTVVTRHRALRAAALRPVPIVNVYALVDSAEEMRAIAFLLSDLPAVVYRLRPRDLLLPPLACDNPTGQSVPRLAAVRGALEGEGHRLPALVVVANPDAISVASVNTKNQLLWAGTTCGILSKLEMTLKAEFDTDHGILSAKRHAQLHERLQAVKDGKSPPLKLFGASPSDQAIGAVLHEAASYLESTIVGWQAEAKKELEAASQGGSGTDLNESLEVVLAGLDAGIVADLLQPEHGGLFDEAVRRAGPPHGIQSAERKNLVAKGVQGVLASRYGAAEAARLASDEEKARQAVVGCRIAKRFQADVYRGSVACFVASPRGALADDIFRVLYDDGDEEDYTAVEIYDHLLLYTKVGEEWARECPDEKVPLLDAKEDQAQAAADWLAKLFPQLAARGARAAARSAGSAAAAGGAGQDDEDAPPGPRLIDASSTNTDGGDQKQAAATLKAPPGGGAGGLPDSVVVEPSGAASAASSLVSVVDGAAAAMAAAAAAAAEGHPSTPASGRKRKKQQSGSSSVSSRGRGRPRYAKAEDLSDPEFAVGRGVAKYFADPDTGVNRLYYGQITTYRTLTESEREESDIKGSVIWDVEYDDGDAEGMDARDLLEALRLYQKHSKGDENAAKRKPY